MRRYLATLHKRPHHHQKNFALAVAGGTTLLIFAVWMLVNFGNPQVVSNAPQNGVVELGKVEEVGPLESLGSSLAASWASIKQTWGSLTQSLHGFDVESGYDEMKQKTLDTYGG